MSTTNTLPTRDLAMDAKGDEDVQGHENTGHDRTSDTGTDLSQQGAKAKVDQQPDSCVICLETIRERCELIPCRHSHFDFSCLLLWFERKLQCPLCKESAAEIRHGPSEGCLLLSSTTPVPSSKCEFAPLAPSSPPRHRLPLHRPARRFRTEAETQQREHDAAEALRAALSRRKRVYVRQLYSKHVGANRISGFQELTPARFNQDEALVSRARMWMRRELQIFPWVVQPDGGPSAATSAVDLETGQRWSHHRRVSAEHTIEIVVGVLKSIDIKGSAGQAQEILTDFLGRDKAMLFLHELANWLRSPCTSLQEWDRMVQYGPSLAASSRGIERRRRCHQTGPHGQRHERADSARFV